MTCPNCRAVNIGLSCNHCWWNEGEELFIPYFIAKKDQSWFRKEQRTWTLHPKNNTLSKAQSTSLL
jgi:hypothetical protein